MSDRNNIIRFVDPASIEAQAAAWIARQDREPPSVADLAAFEAWKALSPEHRGAAERLESLWSEMDLLALKSLDRGVGGQASISRSDVRPTRPDWLKTGLLAASLILAVLAGVVVIQRLPQTEVYETEVGGQKTVNLEDGSSIQLNTNSKVEVRYTPDGRDLRLLKGEAYFDVAPNRQRPFSVYARQDVIKAIGTAFVVRLSDQRVEVTVTKGKVELATISRHPPSAPLTRVAALPRKIITTVSAYKGATELAVIEQETLVQHIDLQPPEASRKLAWRQGMLVFNGESLANVVDDVSRYTDVRIEIVDPALKGLKVGGYFKVGEVDPMLEALESSFGVRVQRLDAKHVRLSAAL